MNILEGMKKSNNEKADIVKVPTLALERETNMNAPPARRIH